MGTRSTTPLSPPVAAADDDLLQQCRKSVRDLVALSTLPSIWVDCDIRRSLQNLTDVLRASLRAVTVCARIELPDGSWSQTGACSGVSNQPPSADYVSELLRAIPSEPQTLVRLPKFDGSGPLNVIVHPVYYQGRQIGLFAAYYHDDFSPTETHPLILQVAANQVAFLFQRHKDQ